MIKKMFSVWHNVESFYSICTVLNSCNIEHLHTLLFEKNIFVMHQLIKYLYLKCTLQAVWWFLVRKLYGCKWVVLPSKSSLATLRQVSKSFTKNVKGVSSKPSGNLIVAPIFCFLSQRLQISDTCLFFNFLKLCKVSERLGKFDIRHFIRVPPLMFFCFCNLPKIQRGDPCKMTNIKVVQSF